jgi:hypothetical protein
MVKELGLDPSSIKDVDTIRRSSVFATCLWGFVDAHRDEAGNPLEPLSPEAERSFLSTYLQPQLIYMPGALD